VVHAFVTVASQWRVVATPLGELLYLGLDYAGVSAGLAAESIAVTPELWRGLRIMEAAARDALNEALG
jgi:hypothetical protein